ncbi:MAG TPA: hypothetical protein VM577_02765, partial [Anaerovoracaceae bacterium]|nr:hypothetical protein [Anaerovoracaceae bacterium]
MSNKTNNGCLSNKPLLKDFLKVNLIPFMNREPFFLCSGCSVKFIEKKITKYISYGVFIFYGIILFL